LRLQAVDLPGVNSDPSGNAYVPAQIEQVMLDIFQFYPGFAFQRFR
jgi:hypothetical protein